MNESDIKDFWNSHPCGDEMAGSLRGEHQGDYLAFFDNYDRFRYSLESHIPRCLDLIELQGKRTLEIGLGQGADSEQLIRRGAVWTGIDLTPEAVQRVSTRLELKGLPHERVVRGSVLNLPFEDQSFDVVFSHGVLHHVPDIKSAQREIRRVLTPDGRLVVMLYAKWSLNYLMAIAVVRRLALLAMYGTGAKGKGKAAGHLVNARKEGLLRYLRLSNFVHRNTDGPDNPYSKVYGLREVAADFESFEIVSARKEFMYAPPLPVRWLPLSRYLGWHLWVWLKPRGI